MSAPQLGGCQSVGVALVNYTPRGIVRRVTFDCPTCERRTAGVRVWDGAWYGSHSYCIACLDGWWSEGYRMERPFQRFWRRDRAREIKRLWDEALLPARYRAWTRWDMHRATCDVEGSCVECETRPS